MLTDDDGVSEGDAPVDSVADGVAVTGELDGVGGGVDVADAGTAVRVQ